MLLQLCEASLTLSKECQLLETRWPTRIEFEMKEKREMSGILVPSFSSSAIRV